MSCPYKTLRGRGIEVSCWRKKEWRLTAALELRPLPPGGWAAALKDAVS